MDRRLGRASRGRILPVSKLKFFCAVSLCALLAAPAPAHLRAAAPLLRGAMPRGAVGLPAVFNSSLSVGKTSALPTVAPLQEGRLDSVGVKITVQAASVVDLPAAAVVPVSPAQGRAAAEADHSRWEGFWSGDAVRRPAEEVAASLPVVSDSVLHPRTGGLKTDAHVPAVVATPFAAPTWAGLKAWVLQISPFLEVAAVVVGTYAANRLASRLIGRYAEKRGLDRHQIAAARLAVGVVLWSAAAAGALTLGGAPPEAIAAVFGTGGTILTLALKDVLGNLIHGINFLITRPYSVGDRIEIDRAVGTVADLTLNGLRTVNDDGTEVRVRYATLAGKPVILFGEYKFPDKRQAFVAPRFPGLRGGLGAVWGSLDRGLVLAAAALGSILFASWACGTTPVWAGVLLGNAAAGAALWLTRRVEIVLVKAVEKIADLNSWRLESLVIARLAVRAGVWAIGGGAVLRAIGVSWTALAASLGLTTLGIGMASNNFFGTVVQGGEVLFSKPFKVGDHLRVGLFEGIVEDMTLYHVVLKVGEGRHALMPYAVVRDAALVVGPTPPNP